MAKRRKRSKPALRSVPTGALHAELRRRRRTSSALARQRARLLARLEALDAKIREFGGEIVRAVRGAGADAVAGRARLAARRKRPKNSMSLEEALAKVLKGRTLGVTEASGAVRKAGYRTTSPNFRTIVNQTLIKSRKFRKVSRGKYTAA